MKQKPENWEELAHNAEILAQHEPDHESDMDDCDKRTLLRTYNQIAFGIMGIPDWKWDLGKAKRNNATCYLSKKKIRYSKYFVEAATSKQMFNTVTHEVAHAVLGRGYKHGYWWKKLHRLMGGNGQRCSSGIDREEIPAKYLLSCDDCEAKWKRYRKSKIVKNPSQYNCKCGGNISVERKR